MPPEPLPWDRKDFRKHDRSASNARLGAGGPPHKWRQQQHHPHAPPPYHHQQRWYSDFRSPRLLPPGHNKQGGWPMYSEDAGQGFMPLGSRYADRNLEQENCRPFGSRGDGRYSRNNRENRGSFTHKDWKAPSWEPAAVPNAPGEPIAEVNNLRSIENTQPCHNRSVRSSDASHPPLSSVSLSDQSQFLVEEKNGGTTDEMPDKVQESGKENCLESVDWEPLKRSRMSSLSTRSSCISHSTSSKSLGLDSIEVMAEVQPENATLDQSPSLDVACVRSNALAQSDETGSRKKPRLGWGEGLAKYEKKKVEGREDGTSKNDLDLSAVSSESPLSQSANLLEKSPILESFWDCASPATPSSVACSSSPGVVEEKSVKDANLDLDTANVSCSPSIASLGHYGGPILNLENLELESIANLSSLINELVQPNAPNFAETGYMQTTSMNKLLVWKVEILKALEMTESEIESLETKFKSLIDEPGILCSYPAGPRSLTGEQQSKPCKVLDTASICGVWHDTSQFVSSGEMIVKDAPVRLEGGHVLSKDEDIDSPGSATSKFVDVQPAIFHSKKAKFSEGARSVDVGNSGGLDKKCLKNIFSSQECPGYVNNLVLNGHTSEDLVGIRKVYCNVDSLYDSILSSNRDAAGRALEQLNKLIPQQCLFGSSIESIVSMQRNSSVVKEKFLKRKQFLQFKEKVLTLKFKVFQHFWKEGRRVSIRTLRGKTRKKFHPCHIGQKRNHSRFSSYAGDMQAVPADEVIKFINDLLSQLAFKPYRNSLKMPALILDEQVRLSRFISNNGFVEDPCAFEKERSTMNPWTAVETEIFMEKLAAFGKDFRKIASFLDHRTVADCIEFYYKNHKSKCFEETRNNYGFVKQRKSQTTYLVASGKRRNPELNAASLDMLGAASEIVAKIDDGMDLWQKCPSRSSFGVSSSCGAPGIVDHLLKGSNSMDMDIDERETEAADVLAGICGSLSSEAMSSSITSSVDLGDIHQDPRCPRICPSIKRPSTHVVIQDVDGEYSDESCGELNPCDWSDEEKSIFIQAVSSYGKDFAMVSKCVRTKSMDQCKVFFSKAKKCLGLDLIQPGAGTASGDDGGGSDVDDDCAMETCSDICNNDSECDMKDDFPPPGMKLNYESDMVNMVPDIKTSKGNNGLGPLDSTTARLLLENSSIVGSYGDDKPVTDFNQHGKGQNVTDDVSFVSVQEPQTVAVASIMESEQRVEKEENLGMAHRSNEVEDRSLVKVSDGYCAEENQCLGPMLPEDNLCSRDANSNDVNDITSGISGKKFEPLPAGSVSHASIDAHSSAQGDKKSDNPKKADVGTCSTENSSLCSLLQNGHFASASSSTLFSVPIKYKKTSNHNPLLPVDASGVDDTPSQNIVSTGDCQQHLSSYSLNSTESFQILQGYPVSLQTVKGTNGDVSCEKLTPLPNVCVRDENLNSDRHADFLLQRYKEARQSNVAFPPSERRRDHSRSQSGSLSVGEKTPRNGDVKLFGKILSSSQQKPNESAEDNSSHDHRKRLESLNLKVSSEQKASFDFRQSKLDCNNYVPAENMPVRRFGFWDGNRIQTGTPLSPMPDSARLLAKYPAAFSNFSMPSFRSRDSPIDGMSAFRDYQGSRNREMQPCSIDMKQPQDDVLAENEIQRRNGFNVASGIHVAGRGGVLFGGQCSSLSDPVAAIKMHYAKAEQHRMRGGNAVDDDRWMSSSRDLGR